jgi:predicted DNA-binding protein with PD1-like motif
MSTGLRPATIGRTFVGRLPTNSDLVEEIERFCTEQGVSAAWVTAVGAVQHLEYAFYNQEALRYEELRSDAHHEMAGFVGNVSMRDGRPVLHAHASFGDPDGECVTGHIRPGTVVWMVEVELRELTDVSLVREHDERTGLALW